MFPGRRRVGLEAEARPVVPDGFVEFPLQAKTDGQVAMRIGVPRVDLDHLAQVRDRVLKVTLYIPGRKSMILYCPWLSVIAVRTRSISAGLLASTVTPGRTAPVVSRTTPAIAVWPCA